MADTCARLRQERIEENKKFLETIEETNGGKKQKRTPKQTPSEEPKPEGYFFYRAAEGQAEERKKEEEEYEGGSSENDETGAGYDEEDERNEKEGNGKRKKGGRNNDPGRRVIGNRIYDSRLGTTCHQCRQKTLDEKVSCTNAIVGRDGEVALCSVKMDQMCLLGRYGETVAAARATGEWVCPKCRGICNCSFCRKKNGFAPTGHISHSAREAGFASVQDYLKHEEEHKGVLLTGKVAGKVKGTKGTKNGEKKVMPSSTYSGSKAKKDTPLKRLKRKSEEGRTNGTSTSTSASGRVRRAPVNYCELDDEEYGQPCKKRREEGSDSETEDDDAEEDEVVKIVDRRRRTGAEVEYLVGWRDGGEETWIKRHLLNCRPLMQEFEEKRKAALRAQRRQIKTLASNSPPLQLTSATTSPSPSPTPTGFSSWTPMRGSAFSSASSAFSAKLDQQLQQQQELELLDSKEIVLGTQEMEISEVLSSLKTIISPPSTAPSTANSSPEVKQHYRHPHYPSPFYTYQNPYPRYLATSTSPFQIQTAAEPQYFKNQYQYLQEAVVEHTQ